MNRDLLVISDLHLGEAHRPGFPLSEDAQDREAALVEFLDHYRTRGEWKLVINGDMVDFLSITTSPADIGTVRGLHPDDHHYGMAQRADSAALQLEQVLVVHHRFVQALADFVGDGHELAIVVGNHDAAFHFPEVQAVLVNALARAWRPDPARLRTAGELAEAVSFHDWFLLEDGLAWIEHGHQYDAYCSFEHQLDPLDPERDELDPTVSGVAMRYVSNHFIPHGENAEEWSFSGYLAFAFTSGKLGEVIGAYAAMSARLLARARVRRRLRAERRKRHMARLRMLAQRARLPEWKLAIVDAQRRMPASNDVREVLSALMLDRLALTGGALGFFGVGLMLPVTWGQALLLGLGVTLLAIGFDSWLASTREDVQPQDRMRRVAQLIRRMIAAPVVVMGHAHDAMVERTADGVYVNTGTWVAGDKRHPNALRAFTHLVLKRTPKGPSGGLFRWVNGRSVQLEPVRT
ncbi:MAG: hypothetical protein EP330_05335 [Deltaproteobacteria bacterium]|nr:MAG: hypothetical protein EP330_05335 [Deltaproteobacteria bacterium]